MSEKVREIRNPTVVVLAKLAAAQGNHPECLGLRRDQLEAPKLLESVAFRG